MIHMPSSKRQREVLLMTCWVNVIAPDSTVTQGRTLPHSVESTSLILKRLAKRLELLCRSSNSKINGVAGIGVRPRRGVNFKVAGVRGGGSILRLNPPSFAKSLLTYPQFLFPQLPSGNTCQIWNLWIQTMVLWYPWTYGLEERSLVRKSFMACGLVPSEQHQHWRNDSDGYWMGRARQRWTHYKTCLLCFRRQKDE